MDEVESGTEFDYGKEELSKSHVSELLSGLQTHLLARCSMSEPQEGSSDLIIEKVFFLERTFYFIYTLHFLQATAYEILKEHLEDLFHNSASVFERSATVLVTNPLAINKLHSNNIKHNSSNGRTCIYF